MEGFVGFTDVQVASSILFGVTFASFALGALFADGTYFFVKWLINRRNKNND